MTKPTMRMVAPAVLAAALAACTVGPDYQKPAATAPAGYKEIAGWKPAEPQPAASGTAWWSIYSDPVLDGLVAQIDVSNQTLKASEAAFRQASALVREAQAGFYPNVTASGSGQRSSQGGSTGHSVVQNQFNLAPAVAWVPDIWGKVRRSVESSAANAQASAADLAAARLSAQASLASDYFQLRVNDAQKAVLEDTIVAYTRSLEIARNQYNAGVTAQTDLITAQTQLENTQAQLINLGVGRALLEHAIAVLVGKAPADFSIAPAPLAMSVPVMPPGMPSRLLERRPDIAAAERAAKAANAQIGVAEGAYFPDLTLTGTAGFAGGELGSLLALSNSFWSIGAQLAGTIFDGGLRGAQVDAARAAYDESVANYRQTVLAGLQQVEDQIASLRILEQQTAVQNSALRDAREAVRLTLNQYQAGTVAYTNVVVAQTTALGDELTALALRQSRLVASVTLVEALGGGWDAAQLPSADAVAGKTP
jgi:NodT family efflux transporter outer membrane factor (OMF) lipoprotein